MRGTMTFNLGLLSLNLAAACCIASRSNSAIICDLGLAGALLFALMGGKLLTTIRRDC